MYFNAQYSNLIDEIDNRSNEEEEPLLKSNEINNSKRKRLESTRSERAIESIDDDDDENWIEGNAFIKYLLLPMTILFKITLPKPTKFLFIITFGMSVVWIGLLTYICVWMVTIIGKFE